MKKLRILCLHGYHGNAHVLRDQMKMLTHGMDHLAEFVHVDAPSLANGDFGWWHAVRDENATGNEDPGVGRVEEIKRQDGHWVVVTARGLIVGLQ